MSKCLLRGAAGLKCGTHLRTTAIVLDGVLSRITICQDHYSYLQRIATPLPVGGPPENPAETPASETPEPEPPATQERKKYARRLVTSCLLDDGTAVPWPVVRELLISWGVDVKIKGGPVPKKHQAEFKERIKTKEDLERALNAPCPLAECN